MDESRIEALLREGRPDELAYVPTTVVADAAPNVERVRRAGRPSRALSGSRVATVLASVAVVVVAVVLVAGLPGGVSAPDATESPSTGIAVGVASPPPGIPANPLRVLTGDEVAALAREGSHAGRAVVSNARVNRQEGLREGCPLPDPTTTCVIGVLSSVEPSVAIVARPRALEPDDDPALPPATDDLAVYRFVDDGVEYLGPLRVPEPGVAWTVAEVGDKDELAGDAMPVLAVAGWLVEAVVECPAPASLSPGDEFPYACGAAWLSDEPAHLCDAADAPRSCWLQVPGALHVQPGAYGHFASDPADPGWDPRHGVYAIRAVGCPEAVMGGCPVWQVLGRFDLRPSDSPIALESPLLTPTSSPEPAASVTAASPSALAAVGAATWRVDPNGPALSADSRSIRVLATERECASGKPPESRVLEPLVEYRQAEIVITVRVAAVGGDCQSNPEFPLTIELDEPIGDRKVLDGSDNPPVERWNPSGVLFIRSDSPVEDGSFRLFQMIGPDGCYTSTSISWDWAAVQRQLDEEAAEIPSEGALPSGRGYIGDLRDAPAALGAIEAYHNDTDAWLIIVPYDGQSWVMDRVRSGWIATRLVAFDLSDGRIAWVPGMAGYDIGDPTCAATSQHGEFELTINANSSVFGPREPIDVEARLVYTGEEPITIAAAGSGPISFGVEEVDGSINAGPGVRPSCETLTLRPDQPLRKRFAKSGGYDRDDPDAEFYETYFSDLLLRLPAGNWRITAYSNFALGPCGARSPEVSIEASIVVTVD